MRKGDKKKGENIKGQEELWKEGKVYGKREQSKNGGKLAMREDRE